MRKIYVADFTLNKLAGERKNPLLFREKSALASCADEMGVDAIELAPIVKEKEDTVVYKTIAKNVKNAALCIPVGDDEKGVETAWEAIKDAVKPCLQVVLPLSTVSMEYTYHLKSDKMLPKIESLVKAAREKCENVEFVALDAARAEREFLIEALKTAVESGAGAVTVSDDAGILLPYEFAEFVKEIKPHVSVPLYIRANNNLRMAVATAFAAAEAGADGIKAVIKGSNELKIDDLAKAVSLKGESAGISINVDVTKAHSTSRGMRSKIDETETVGDDKADVDTVDIFLDSESTLDQISEACAALGYNLSEEDLGNVERGLRRVCETKSCVEAKELEAVIASYSMRAPSTYHLESFTTTSSNLSPSMAHVVLTKDGSTQISGSGVGDGPVDAAFGAIEQAIGYHYELDEFAINTVTQGKESLGSALIKLRSNGNLYSGNGISTNIVGACIRAYINALNKIVYDNTDEED